MKFWYKIEDNLFVIKSDQLEDFRAVLSSKVSRRIDLEDASNLNKNKINDFLLRNLLNYGHSSIAEMSFPSIFIKNIGWISSWILADDPLFIGQEVSTRAVFKNILNPCREFNNNFNKDFIFFKNIFLDLKKKLINNKGYKFDYIRWALPGGFSTGIILNLNSRVLNRHINRIRNLNWFNKTIYEQIIKGFQECCPLVYKSLTHKKKIHSILWNKIDIIEIENRDRIFNQPITFDFSLFDEQKFKNNNLNIDFNKKEYIDKFTDYFGLIKIKIFCTLAAARDFHRHRTGMPIKLNLLVDNNRQPFFSKLYDISNYRKEIKQYLNNKIIKSNFINYYDLYQFPLGMMCCLEGIFSLSNLVYMLKLRSSSENANFEYKHQALYGLKKLFDKLNIIYKKNI